MYGFVFRSVAVVSLIPWGIHPESFAKGPALLTCRAHHQAAGATRRPSHVLPYQVSVGAQHAAPAVALPSLIHRPRPAFRSAGVPPALLTFPRDLP
jgi:hypothetical protein